MADLGGTSIELNAIEEECTEQATDVSQGETIKQNVEENIEGIVEKNSGKPPLSSSQRKIDSKPSKSEGNVVPKRKISLRKKSRVEFRVKPNATQDEVKLSTDSLNKISNVGRRSSAHARQSFSGMEYL